MPKGVFVWGDCQLEQLTVEAIGQDAQGILILPPDQAAAYTKVTNAVSAKALGLIVLGSEPLEGAVVQHGPIRFTATLNGSQDPSILPGVLYQLGRQAVTKFA